ncbi:hypothetical protein HUG10_20995 (plasmid) [Halorarum halophilum]|uniref:Uncharacterized protein n=1 Tax=Halorarum halophilum TaxID=2743090 RepID=A0A7D5GEU0_9EURY|nr:hypothetical protein [Halobaculum halophilum]QLG30065.1 hypothetical protein HUG10_20995 [Halobaculum halophilum]
MARDDRIRIALDNGEVFEISVADAAYVLAKHKYPDKGESHYDERRFFEEDPEEAKWDLPNTVGWDELRAFVTRVEEPAKTDYDDLLMSADLRVIANE